MKANNTPTTYLYYIDGQQFFTLPLVVENVQAAFAVESPIICAVQYMDEELTKKQIILYTDPDIIKEERFFLAGLIATIKEQGEEIIVQDDKDENMMYKVICKKDGLYFNDVLVNPMYKIDLVAANEFFAKEVVIR